MDVESLVSEDQLMEIIEAIPLYGWEKNTIDELGERISRSIGPPDQHDPESGKYWHAVKDEIYLLICTDDKKYADLRKQLEKGEAKSSTAIVALITASLTFYIGMVAGIVVPLCALVLLAVTRVGKNAFCKDQELNEPIRRRTT